MDNVRTGMVQTVLGLVEPEHIGIALMHEHLLIDFHARYLDPPEASRVRLGRVPVSMDLLYELRSAPYDNLDNLYLVDERQAIEEVMEFTMAGGRTIVDATTLGLGRDPVGLQRISRATGLNVTMGAGYYIDVAHPAGMDDITEEAIFSQIVGEIEAGVGDTEIRCGHIGEIGCEDQTENEMKVLRAAARAQAATGALLIVHQIYRPEGPDANRIGDAIEAVGGDLSRTVLSHMDASGADVAYQESLLRRGFVLAYDSWGLDWYVPSLDLQLPSDADRVRGLVTLIDRGWIDQVVISQDICMKLMLERFGGYGYGHILKRIVPRLRHAGLDADAVDTLLVQNPKRLLPFVGPTA